MGRGNESLFKKSGSLTKMASLDSSIDILYAISWSHNQDGRHVHIC